MSLDLWESTKQSPAMVFYELKYKLVCFNMYVYIYTHSAPAAITAAKTTVYYGLKKANMSGAQWVILNKEVYL